MRRNGKPKLRPKVNCNKQTVFAVITSLVGLAGPSERQARHLPKMMLCLSSASWQPSHPPGTQPVTRTPNCPHAGYMGAGCNFHVTRTLPLKHASDVQPSARTNPKAPPGVGPCWMATR